MAVQGTLTEWIAENAPKFKDRESLIEAAQKHSPSSSRKTVLNRIYDMVKDGRLPATYGHQAVAATASERVRSPLRRQDRNQ